MSLEEARFALQFLTVLAYSNGITFWSYRAHAVTEVMEPGFFSPAADQIVRGDWIFVSAQDGGVQLYVTSDAPLTVEKV